MYAELTKATPNGLRVLKQSPATDQDAYTVTKEFSDKWGVKNISDLKKVTDSLTLGANSEAESRPYGPAGLEKAYGVQAAFSPIEDGGGPLTVRALKDNDIQFGHYLHRRPIGGKPDHLVSLADPNGLFLASNVVPLRQQRCGFRRRRGDQQSQRYAYSC